MAFISCKRSKQVTTLFVFLSLPKSYPKVKPTLPGEGMKTSQEQNQFRKRKLGIHIYKKVHSIINKYES